MEKSKEESLHEAVLFEDQETVLSLIDQGANPNKIISNGKTCLGACADNGNIEILKLLINASKNPHPSNAPKIPKPRKKRFRFIKRKLRHRSEEEQTIAKYKSPFDTSKEIERLEKRKIDKNQGYFIFIHNDAASSEESLVGNLKSPNSLPSLPSSPDSDLEWDEEICNVAPTTSEDEKWSSMYKWYADILESTGAAIASAPGVNNGIDQQDAFGRSALHYAAEKSHVEVVKLLVEAGCKLDIPGGSGLNALHQAVINNNMDIIKILLSAGGDVNYETHEKMTPLHFATSRGFLDVVKLLVTSGAHLDARDANERTALYIGTGRSRVDIVKYLIAAGANVNGEEIHGYTPLCEAVWQKGVTIVEELLLAGARIPHCQRLLHVAIMQKQEQILELLTLYGGGINLHNENGDTPLLLAIRLKQLSIAKILIAKGANVNARNSITGSNALHVAVETIEDPEEFEELLKCLADHVIDMDATALTGDTALNRAVLLRKTHAAVLLIRYGADVNTWDLNSRGLDNLSIARRHYSVVIVTMLIKAGHYVTMPDASETVPMPMLGSPAYHVYNVCRQPLNLSEICRIKIRRQAKGKIFHRYIWSLPLPDRIKRYLMMEDMIFDYQINNHDPYYFPCCRTLIGQISVEFN